MPGLGKKTFTAGDVLIAGDVNNYLMDQTVMNFATVAARSSAIPVPSTGMVSYVGTTGTALIPQIETYTGSGWQTPYGLTQVANATFTAQSTVSIDNVFTSAYSNYVILTTLVPSTLTDLNFRLRTGGADNTTANYNNLLQILNNANVFGTSFNAARIFGYFGRINTSGKYTSRMEIFEPNLATPTNIQTDYQRADGTSNSQMGVSVDIFQLNTIFDGISIYPLLGTITGNIRIYGYRNS